MCNPKITIIIPVYNTEALLARCLESGVAQSMQSIEIICVDDGSTDGSGAILDEWACRDERIKVIHQSNGRQGKARNAALNIAQGDYIGMIDSDDYIPAEYLPTFNSTKATVKAEGGDAYIRSMGNLNGLELAVLKKHIFPLLTEIQPEDPCYEQVRAIVKVLNFVREADVDDEIPPTSLVREFIGGNSFYRDNK